MDRSSWMMIYGVGLYLVWGISLCFSDAGMGATVMDVFQDNNINHITLGILFLVTGSMTLFGLICKMVYKRSILGLCFFFPQQILLMINAIACINAIVHGEYADHVQRPFSFIFIDQFPFIFAGVIHTLALLDVCLFPSYNDR